MLTSVWFWSPGGYMKISISMWPMTSLRQVNLFNVKLCYIVLHRIMLHYVTYVTLCHDKVTIHYVALHYMTSMWLQYNVTKVSDMADCSNMYKFTYLVCAIVTRVTIAYFCSVYTTYLVGIVVARMIKVVTHCSNKESENVKALDLPWQVK